MSDQWHCVIDGETVGPLSEEEMLRRISSKQIDLDTLVWKKGMSAWAPLRSVPELRAAAWAKTNAGADDAPPPIPPQSSPNLARSQSHGDFGSSHLETSGPSPYPFAAHKPIRRTFKTWILINASPLPFAVLLAALSSILPSSLKDWGATTNMFLAIFPWLIIVPVILFFNISVLYQARLIIQGNPKVRVSPVMGWLGLIIPIVNIFWAFVTFWGWARSYNNTLDAFKLDDAPRATEWIFFVLSVSWAVGNLDSLLSPAGAQSNSVFLGVNALIFLMSLIAGYWQMCSAINYFADKAEEETQTGQATE